MTPFNYKLPIVYYHSVAPYHPHWKRSFLSLDPVYFEDQLKYFKKNFNVIHLKEYWGLIESQSGVAKNHLVITFDDGYLDNWVYVFPLLKKYGLKATIFISPEFVDKSQRIRPTLEDVWKNNVQPEALEPWGYLNWEEMKIMEQSGLVEIQSHTMSHTKYFVSGHLIDFHHPKADNTNIITNLFPGDKPYYIQDANYNERIPYGYPVFENASSVIAHRVWINPEFTTACVEMLNHFDFAHYDRQLALGLVQPILESYRNQGKLIIATETDQQYAERVAYEIVESKNIIEKELGKKVEFLCWPHGDNSAYAHQVAITAGYKATTWGKLDNNTFDSARIPFRIGTSAYRNSRFLTLRRAAFKIDCARKKFPYYAIYRIYQKIKY